MRLVVDMNLSPAWVGVLRDAGHQAEHWTDIGSPNAPDQEILSWARNHQSIVFTNDLDFGAILATSESHTPSVLQIRAQDLTPAGASTVVLQALHQFAPQLQAGALITIDPRNTRARILPILPTNNSDQ